MNDFKDISAPWAALSPLSLMQNYWRLWAEWQQSLLNNWLTGFSTPWQPGMEAGQEELPGWPGMLDASSLPAVWAQMLGVVPGAIPGIFNPANLADLGQFMPHVAARITPLETSGPLAGAAEAARLSMRLSLPGVMGPAETVVVEAVVARAPQSEADKLSQTSVHLLEKKSD